MILTNKQVRSYSFIRKGLTILLSGALFFSSTNAISLIKKVEDTKHVKIEMKSLSSRGAEVSNSDAIVAATGDDEFFTGKNILYNYNNNLYTTEATTLFNIKNGFSTPISLEKGCNSLAIIGQPVTEKLLSNIKLKISQISRLSIHDSTINNGGLDYFPNGLIYLSLTDCSLLNNLSNLPNICPKIETLHIENLPSISNYDFLFNFKNLKEVYFGDSAYITEDLLKKLRAKNIKTDINELDVIVSKNIDDIVSKITNDSMTEEGKLLAISRFILNNFNYDLNLSEKSNEHPLKCFFEHQSGVCVSYSFLTTVLLNKAGINSISVYNLAHAWNTVELDGNIYTLDNTLYSAKLPFLDKLDNHTANFFNSPSMELETIKIIEEVIKSNMMKDLDVESIRKLFLSSKPFSLVFSAFQNMNSSYYFENFTGKYNIEAIPLNILADIKAGMKKEDIAKKYSIEDERIVLDAETNLQLNVDLTIIFAVWLLLLQLSMEDIEKLEQFKVRSK